MSLPEPIPPDDLVEYIDAAGNEDLWYNYSAALKQRESTGDLQAGWLMTAFDYHLRRRVREDRNQATDAFGSQIETTAGGYPIRLPDVPAEVIALWSNTADRVTSDGAKARLHHLLFERGDGNRGHHAREAAAGYAGVGVSSTQRLTRVNALHWAIDLYKRIGDKSTAAVLHPALIALANESLDQDQPEPGVALHAIEVLAFEDPSDPSLPGLLERCRQEYTDPYLTADIVRINEQVAKGDPVAQAALRRERAQRYLDHGMSFQPGLMRMMFLEDAAKLAERDGITDLRDEAIREMQQISIDDLDLKTVTSKIELPPEVVATIEDHIAAVIGLPSIKEVFQTLAFSRPPTGDLETNKKQQAQHAQDAPFANLFPRIHLRSDGLAAQTSASAEEREEAQLTQIEMWAMQFEGRFIARMLDGALQKFAPTNDQIMSALAGLPHVTEPVARSVTRGLQAFAAGRYEEAATVVMPRIETLIRALCDEKDVLLFRPEQQRADTANRRGQYPQLGALLAKLRPWTDPSWDRFLSTFLVSAVGANFRNDLLHGYVDDVGPTLAALTLLLALRLILVPLPAEPITDNDGPAGEGRAGL